MTGGFMGIAGYNMWDGFIHPNANQSFDEEVLWPSTIRAQQHMNANDVINTLKNSNGSWIQGRQMEEIHGLLDETESKETQYYISSNQNMAVGYVRNRSYNIHSNRLNDECWLNFDGNNIPVDSRFNIDWNDGLSTKSLKIEGLKKNKDYRIDWYDFETGNYIETQCQNTQNTNLILEFPSLEVESNVVRPVLWYVVSRIDCDKSLEGELTANEMEKFLTEQKFDIYPNPFSGDITIELFEDETIILFNAYGLKINEFNLTKGKNIIDLESLANGVYYFYYSKSSTTFKVLKL